MMIFSRADRSHLAHWWWTVDRWLLMMVSALLVTGFWLTLTASPAVAERLGLGPYHFVWRQLFFLGLGFMTVLMVSVLPLKWIRRGSVMALPFLLILMILALVIGPEIKGATRWLQIGSLTLQPS